MKSPARRPTSCIQLTELVRKTEPKSGESCVSAILALHLPSVLRIDPMKKSSSSAPTPTPSPYDGIEHSDKMFCSYAEREGRSTKILRPFSAQEFDARWKNVYDGMREHGLDCFVLSSPESIYYLTNYQTPGNPFTVLVAPIDAEPCLITRELEGSNAVRPDADRPGGRGAVAQQQGGVARRCRS